MRYGTVTYSSVTRHGRVVVHIVRISLSQSQSFVTTVSWRFAASIAHKSDIGGAAPGSCPATARDTFFEGLHIPPVKLLSGGKENKEAFALLRGNSRAPALVIGDLEGQIGVCSLGSDRIRQLFDRFGIDLTLFAFDHYRRETQRRIEQRLQELNDFEGTAERFIDHDGIDLETPKGIRVEGNENWQVDYI